MGKKGEVSFCMNKSSKNQVNHTKSLIMKTKDVTRRKHFAIFNGIKNTKRTKKRTTFEAHFVPYVTLVRLGVKQFKY